MDASDLIRTGEAGSLELAVASKDPCEDNLSRDEGCLDKLGGIVAILLCLLLDFASVLAGLDFGKETLDVAANLGCAIQKGEGKGR